MRLLPEETCGQRACARLAELQFILAMVDAYLEAGQVKAAHDLLTVALSNIRKEATPNFHPVYAGCGLKQQETKQ